MATVFLWIEKEYALHHESKKGKPVEESGLSRRRMV
jgi:hypothetical protein